MFSSDHWEMSCQSEAILGSHKRRGFRRKILGKEQHFLNLWQSSNSRYFVFVHGVWNLFLARGKACFPPRCTHKGPLISIPAVLASGAALLLCSRVSLRSQSSTDVAILLPPPPERWAYGMCHLSGPGRSTESIYFCSFSQEGLVSSTRYSKCLDSWQKDGKMSKKIIKNILLCIYI